MHCVLLCQLLSLGRLRTVVRALSRSIASSFYLCLVILHKILISYELTYNISVHFQLYSDIRLKMLYLYYFQCRFIQFSKNKF